MDEPRIDFLEEAAPEEVTEPEVPETPEPETVATPEPPAAEVPTTPEPKEETVPLAALKAEREKRQKYERELAEYRQRAQQPAPQFSEAPEHYVQHLVQQTEQQLTARMLGALEAQAREVYPDYDEVFEVVQQHAQENPVVVQQVLNAPNPAIAAYQLGKRIKELEAMKDPDAYRKQIEAEVRAKVLAEVEAEKAAKAKAAEAIPPDLTAARASKDTEVPPDDSLEAILQSRKR